MRVVSGKAKGTSLFSPQGKSVRPTSDYIKENLFNLIGLDVQGAHFLDAFAGSAAIGIEALSRGATHAVFIDSSQKSIDLAKRNLEKTRLTQYATVIKGEVPSALKKLSGQKFDIIFLDPPYFEEHTKRVLDAILELNILDKHGQVIVEASEMNCEIAHPSFNIFKEKIYGNTKVIFMEVIQ